jgi:CRP-like cAMP-binding protein
MEAAPELTLMEFPLFDGYTVHGTRLVLQSGNVREIDGETLLFREGDPPSSVFLVIEGGIEVFVDREGHHLTLTTISPGAIMGELATLCAMPRSASARAAEPSLVLEWSPQAFRTLLLGDTELSKRVFANALKAVVEKEQALISELTGVPVAKHHAHPPGNDGGKPGAERRG